MIKIGFIASSIQKAFRIFSDNFNRTTSGSLGLSSSSGLWEAIKGTWFANGSSAQTADSASTYPISAVKMSKEDVTASISTGSGSTLISSTGTVGSIVSGDNITGTSGFHWATITGMSSTAGLAVGNYISATNGSGSLYGGMPDYVEITEIVSSSSIRYRIKGGTAPSAGTITDITSSQNDGGSGVSIWVTDSGNWWGVTYGRSTESCNCSACQSSSCAAYSTSGGGYVCGGYSNTGDTCAAWVVAANKYAFSSPGKYLKWSGDTCSSYRSNYTCSGGTWARPYSTSCSTTVYSYSSCNCETCYPGYIRLIQSASNVVSEVTRWTLSSMAGAFKVIANPVTKVISIKPYKDQSMTTQIGSDLTYTATNATIDNKFGIVLGPSDQIQGTNVDNFNAEAN